ncbi:OTU domain-containing protein 7B-like [Oopsacas minuta]|uniref:ubiquitinyl hydrolase 1 n=1 Tax=Oopsacas minuta TaxID=111878 RepID=A0AAV7K8U8_9METZ|nr:OTU domain-containing protein 7B-like [Oopsacas minuta]
MSSYSTKAYSDKLRLYNYFLAQGHDGEFLRDLLIQCNWSKTQTNRVLEEMKKGNETMSSSPGRKDKATGQKTGSLSVGLGHNQDFSTSSILLKKVKSQPKLLEGKKYQQLIERCKHFRITFYLGEVEFQSEELREFAPKIFFESSHFKYLYERLNWWVKYGNYTPLAPLRTQGDGNCLLHAVSRAIFGVEDEELVLRGLLHDYLGDPVESRKLKCRWKRQQAELNGRAGFEFDEGEWENEWHTIVSLASLDISISDSNLQTDEPDSSVPSLPYKSLEEVHIFALAHVINRPIIVISDSVLQDVDGRPISPVYFGGVYLPLDRDPKKCYQIPIVLTYCCSHFAPLVACYNDLIAPGVSTIRFQEVVIPLVGPEGDRLSIQFQDEYDKPILSSFNNLLDRYPSPIAQDVAKLSEYLDIEEITISDGKTVLAAKIWPSTHEFYTDIINNLISHTEVKFEEYKVKKAKELRQKEEREKREKDRIFQSSYPPVSPQFTYSRPSYTLPSSFLPAPLTSKLSPQHTRGDILSSNKTNQLYPHKTALNPYSDLKFTEIQTTISPCREAYQSPTRSYLSPPQPSSYYRDTSSLDRSYLPSSRTREQATNTENPKTFPRSNYLDSLSKPSSSQGYTSFYNYTSKPDTSYNPKTYISSPTEPYPMLSTTEVTRKKRADPSTSHVELMDLARDFHRNK